MGVASGNGKLRTRILFVLEDNYIKTIKDLADQRRDKLEKMLDEEKVRVQLAIKIMHDRARYVQSKEPAKPPASSVDDHRKRLQAEVQQLREEKLRLEESLRDVTAQLRKKEMELQQLGHDQAECKYPA